MSVSDDLQPKNRDDRSMGVPPMPEDLTLRQGSYLPHRTRKGAVYSVTFRLADSLPQNKLRFWKGEREDIIQSAKAMNRALSADEKRDLQMLSSDRVQKYLDAGYGACWLKDPLVAQVIVDAFRYFEGQRYRLLAWCIMPNHIHVVIQPLSNWALPSILHSWKSFTAKKANELLGRAGHFWHAEYYDHMIRDEQHLLHAIAYAWRNPDVAGIKNWPWRWISQLFTFLIDLHGRDAHDTHSAMRND